MASLVILRNPLAPHCREMHPLDAGTSVIDWLQAEHPAGFGMPIRFYVNGAEKPLDDLDYEVAEADVAVIALMPAEPISLTALAVQFLIAAALTAASYFATQAFAPKETQRGSKGERRTAYELNADQNAAKIGDPIPVVYGTVLTAPDYIAQPYTWFQWSLADNTEPLNGIQYLDVIMCIGQGNVDVSDVFVGDTDVTTLPAGVVNYQVFKPAQHRSTMGVIAAAMGADFFENVVTSLEVSNQELPTPGTSAGYFATCKPGQKGSRFQLDFTCPSGMYFVDANNDDIDPYAVDLTVNWVELDDNDNQIGTVYSTTVNISTFAPNVTNNAVLNSPVRRTFTITAAKSARWAVKITRVSATAKPQKGASQVIWSGLKLILDNVAGTVYGNVTLLVARIKASRGLGTDAAVRVRVKATRRLTPPTGGTEAQSTSGADAFSDVYVNAVYGAARPRSELDTTTLTSLRTKWASYQFNYVFRDRITVWEALRTITTPFAAEPLPLGAIMSVAQDGRKSVRSALFTDANIVAGSLNVTYSFDEEGAADGVEIEYLDPKDFRQSYALYPSISTRPDRFVLPGVTNATHAMEYATLTHKRTIYQRKRVSFDTELEGLLLQLGDRIGIAHNVPKWGDSGLVLAVDGRTLVVDHDLDWTGGAKQILLRKPDGSVTDAITVTQGAAANMIVLPSTAPTTINWDNDYEYTSFAFGTSTTLVRDFLVTAVTPTGENTVTVEAINYNQDVYTSGMGFLIA